MTQRPPSAKKTMPWFKQYPANFIAGVSGMKGEHIGVYSVLLNLMYARRAKLETRKRRDDLAGLARVCGVSTRRFGQILADLMAMPNKITMDAAGRLSNPKFERMVAGFDDDEEGAEKEQNGEQSREVFAEINRAKISPKDDEKTHFLQPQLFKNKDLTPQKPLPARARARHRRQNTEVEGNAGGSAEVVAATPAEHMNASDFSKWVTACARTIPRGWSRPKALKRWEALPITPWEDLADAWHLYIDDNREKSKGAKFKHRTQYPENWLRDRIFESYLDLVNVNREQNRNAQAAVQARAERRTATITQWNGNAQDLIGKIGDRKFELFVGSVLTVLPDGTHEIDFGKNDSARSEAEAMHWDTLERAFKKWCVTSDRKRQSDADYAARKAKT